MKKERGGRYKEKDTLFFGLYTSSSACRAKPCFNDELYGDGEEDAATADKGHAEYKREQALRDA